MSVANIPIGATAGSALIVDGLRWRFSAAGRNALLPEHLDLSEHLQRGTAETVKHGPHRTVYRVRLPEFNIFWKHCRINDLGSYLRQCIRPPKARLEFDRALALAARGIATVEPLAWGQSWWRPFGPSHLITRELIGAVPLQTFLLERNRGRSRREAAELLGKYLAQLHEAGVAHPDLHPGNILVVLEPVTEWPPAEPRFHLLDIHNVHIGAPLSPRQSRENLAVFNRWFIVRCERSDRLRFWESYAEGRRFGVEEARRLAKDVERRTHSSNFEFWKKRDDRCFKSNRYFQRIRSSVAVGHAVKEFDRDGLQPFLADPDAPFRQPDCRILKNSPSSTVAEIVVSTPDGPRTMIYKRFRLKKRWAALINRVRSSAALRSWQMGHALLDRWLPTPRPWLVLHRRGLSGPREGYLLCEKVDDAADLGDYALAFSSAFRGRAGEGLAKALINKRNGIAALGRMLKRFHEAGLSHRDLKAPNLLVKALPAEIRFNFIDLVGVGFCRNASEAVRIRNLSRLNASFLQNSHITLTDKLRFLRAYLCWGLRGQAEWKRWWKQIAGATQAKIERNRRSGRPLA